MVEQVKNVFPLHFAFYYEKMAMEEYRKMRFKNEIMISDSNVNLKHIFALIWYFYPLINRHYFGNKLSYFIDFLLFAVTV